MNPEIPTPPPAPVSRHWISQRLRLRYADWGNRSAPTLILSHGLRDHARSWDRVAAALADRFHVIAPDLRGHGDSAWCSSGQYTMASFVYDLAQLIEAEALAPVSIVGHSLGGNIALRYAGIYPEKVARLVAIEGMGPPPGDPGELTRPPIEARMRDWIEQTRARAARTPTRFATIEEALDRMRRANRHLSEELARHLTEHALKRDEDGTYGWKFDPDVRVWPPVDMTREEIARLWGRITCPTLLVYGSRSWATNPALDGRLGYFRDGRVLMIDGAGHWSQHDRPALFIEEISEFLSN